MRTWTLLGLSALLVGCGGGVGDRAVDACAREIETKFADRSFAMDRADMSASAKEEADGVVSVKSGITFDPGLPREVKQTFECKARMNGDNVDIISLNFIW